ncbi:hypothetical protein F2Q69_00014500 [Brassica cretica]|uniref:Uncharacterized protein n=1 Tax=Brassica cretica TaxID=69181 RepID=A0A8S9QMD7_BRACR|nr:hypothetical protein F2Q69_00014500 [Brassica cretica]
MGQEEEGEGEGSIPIAVSGLIDSYCCFWVDRFLLRQSNSFASMLFWICSWNSSACACHGVRELQGRSYPGFITHQEQTQLLNHIYGASGSKWKTLKKRRLQNWGCNVQRHRHCLCWSFCSATCYFTLSVEGEIREAHLAKALDIITISNKGRARGTHASIADLEKEKQSHKKKLEQFLSKASEERAAWWSREHEKV